jgi:hypothetical protein
MDDGGFDHVLQYLVVRIVSSRSCHVDWRARVRAICVVVEAERQARLRPIVQRNGKNRSRRFRVDRFSIPSAGKTCYGTWHYGRVYPYQENQEIVPIPLPQRMRLFSPDARTRLLLLCFPRL